MYYGGGLLRFVLRRSALLFQSGKKQHGPERDENVFSFVVPFFVSYTLKDSPQPHLPFSLGFVNTKPAERAVSS